MEKVKIEEIVMKDRVWAYIARETIEENYDFRRQSLHYGNLIADQVVKNRLSTADLRKCAVWAGSLAHETAVIIGDDLSQLESDEYTEFLARRLLHSSTRTALKEIGSGRRIRTTRNNHSRRREILEARASRSLFQLEPRDLAVNDLVASGQQGTLNGRIEI